MNKALSCMVALFLFAPRIMAQTTTSIPTAADAQRAAEVDQRGDEGMGFSHAMTGHHFHLLPDEGSIEVESDSPEDDASKEAIRRHMQKIAGMFAQGEFFSARVYPRHGSTGRGSDEAPKRSNRLNSREYSQRRSSADCHCEPGSGRLPSTSFCASRSKTTAPMTRWQSTRLGEDRIGACGIGSDNEVVKISGKASGREAPLVLLAQLWIHLSRWFLRSLC